MKSLGASVEGLALGGEHAWAKELGRWWEKGWARSLVVALGSSWDLGSARSLAAALERLSGAALVRPWAWESAEEWAEDKGWEYQLVRRTTR